MRIITRRDTGLLTQWTFGERGGYLAETVAFGTATGITDVTILNSINTFIVSSKADGTWNTYSAVYPFVGGTATTHKFNLVNPADTDAAYRLLFVGGWTHASTGATPNGTTAYANTYLIPSNVFNAISVNISYYRRTRPSLSFVQMGALDTTRLLLASDFGGSGLGNINEIVGASQVNRTAITTLGLITGNRTNSANFKTFVNGSLIETVTRTITSQPNISLYIGALNQSGTASNFTNNQVAFATIGTGMTDTQAANAYTNIQAFQTANSRQV